MEQRFEKIGEVHRGDNDIYYFFKDEAGRIFIHDDEDKFKVVRYPDQYRVDRVVSRTVFYGTRTATDLRFETKEEKDLLAEIESQCCVKLDQSFIDFVQLFERRRWSVDLEKFKYCQSITSRVLLPELSRMFQKDSAERDKTYYLINASFDTAADRRYDAGALFLEIISPTHRGYLVEHHELTPELYALSKLSVVKKQIMDLPAFEETLVKVP